jgi:hypothetical protein
MIGDAERECIRENARHCPMIVREVHLKDLSLLNNACLWDFCVQLGRKRLAESVALADGKGECPPNRSFKRARNESTTSLESMVTENETEAAKSLAEMSSIRASP